MDRLELWGTGYSGPTGTRTETGSRLGVEEAASGRDCVTANRWLLFPPLQPPKLSELLRIPFKIRFAAVKRT